MASSSPGQRRLEVLTREACIERLQACSVGRMGVTWRGEPHVLPVNYRWMGDAVVVRTDANTPLGSADGEVAVLEIDSVDAQTRTGWSVVVRGRCSSLDGPGGEQPAPGREDAEAGAVAAAFAPWVPGAKERRMRISADSITGRRVSVNERLVGTEWWRQSASS